SSASTELDESLSCADTTTDQCVVTNTGWGAPSLDDGVVVEGSAGGRVLIQTSLARRSKTASLAIKWAEPRRARPHQQSVCFPPSADFSCSNLPAIHPFD